MKYSIQQFPGLLPIRVLQHNLVDAFTKLNPAFEAYAKQMIQDGKILREIGMDAREFPVASPEAWGFGRINLNEPFLAYIWCFCYGMSIINSELNEKMAKNQHLGEEVAPIDHAVVRDALKVFEYGVSLVSKHSDWDLSLPNPESYDLAIKMFVETTNGLHVAAMLYVLAHEFAHIELGHMTRMYSTLTPEEQSIVDEKEADARAIELVLEGKTEENKDTLRFGILMGHCSLLFFSPSTQIEGYPDTDDRIEAYLQLMNPDPVDPMWAIATLAYKLWDRQYGIGLRFQEGLESHKDLYYSIKRQIEEKKLCSQ